MIYDPNSVLPQSHEARVRARGVRLDPNSNATHQVSTRSDFIAPDYAPASTHELELEKGLAGWSDGPKPASVLPVFTDWAKRDLAAISIGNAIVTRKTPDTMAVMNRQGPSTRKRSKYAN